MSVVDIALCLTLPRPWSNVSLLTYADCICFGRTDW